MKPKLYKCREKAPGCKVQYEKWTGHIQRQGVCQNPACLLSKAEKNRKKKEAKERRSQHREDKARKEALKSRGDHLQEAQREFNKFIRMRDAGKPCISCGKHRQSYDAGHFKTVKARPDLRFCESACHLQCVYCNHHLSGNIHAYREAMEVIYGMEFVDHLERGPRGNSNWSIEEIKEIKQFYKEEQRLIKNN